MSGIDDQPLAPNRAVRADWLATRRALEEQKRSDLRDEEARGRSWRVSRAADNFPASPVASRFERRYRRAYLEYAAKNRDGGVKSTRQYANYRIADAGIVLSMLVALISPVPVIALVGTPWYFDIIWCILVPIIVLIAAQGLVIGPIAGAVMARRIQEMERDRAAYFKWSRSVRS